jgi:hypothetical protein
MSTDQQHTEPVPAARRPGPDPAPAGVPDTTSADAAARAPRRWRTRRWVALGAAVAALLLVWGPWRGVADVRDGTTAVSRQEMAARHGIDVNLVAVTAAGGLIELRMQVTDPDRADLVVNDPDQRPVLVSEETGETLAMAAPPHHRDELQLGRQYFFLLANAHDALHEGAEVTLVVGDSRLEHLEVQG